MKNKFLKVITLSFLCLFLAGCKKNEKNYSLTGCIVTSSNDKTTILYAKAGDTKSICSIPSNEELEILDYEDYQVKVKYIRESNPVTGWVFIESICPGTDILLRSLEPALNGNKTAANFLNSDYKDLTFDDAMNALSTIINIVGKEKIKKINPEKGSDKLIFKALSIVLDSEFGRLVPDYTTRQIHLLADCANKETLEYFYQALSYDYVYNPFDSMGLSCHMRAVKEENLDALKFYDALDIPESYLKDNHKDNEGRSLEDYIINCKDSSITDFMTSVLMSSEKNLHKIYEYLEARQAEQDFKLINILFDPLPFTDWNAEHKDAERAFVFMFTEDEPELHFIDYDGVLNVRDNNDLSSKVIGKLKYGTPVTIIEKSDEMTEIDGVSDYWYKVESKEIEGWCWGGYLVVPKKVVQAKYAKGESPVTTYTQNAFEEKSQTTVIKDTEIMLIDGKHYPVKAFEEVTVIKRLYNYDYPDLWDYEDTDANSWASVYCPRYNYYLVRNKDYKTGIIGGSNIVHEKLEMQLENKSHKPPFDFYVNYLTMEESYRDYYPYAHSHDCVELFEAKEGKIRKLNPTFTLWNEPLPVNFAYDLTEQKVYLADYCEFNAEHNFYHETDGEKLWKMYSLIIKSKGAGREGLYTNYYVPTVLDVEGRLEMFESFISSDEENSETSIADSRCFFDQGAAGKIPLLKLEKNENDIDYDSYEEADYTETQNYQDYNETYTYFFDSRHLLFEAEEN